MLKSSSLGSKPGVLYFGLNLEVRVLELGTTAELAHL